MSTDTSAPATPLTESAKVAAAFAGDVASHEMTVLHDDGPYRHVRFAKPGTKVLAFELSTTPGVLTITGDMGTYVFERDRDDMFAFFGPDSNVNHAYWSEKLTAHTGAAREYSPALFVEAVNEFLEEHIAEIGIDADWAADLREAVADDVLDCSDDEDDARDAAMRFRRDLLTFTGVSDWELTGLTYNLAWCMHAITWGVGRYAAARDSAPS